MAPDRGRSGQGQAAPPVRKDLRPPGRRAGGRVAVSGGVAAHLGFGRAVPEAAAGASEETTAFDTQVVLHMLDAGDVLHAALRPVLRLAAIHRTGERHLRAGDRDRDFRGVHPRVVGQALVRLVQKPFVRPLVALRATAAVLTFEQVAADLVPRRAEPRGDPLAGAAEELLAPGRLVLAPGLVIAAVAGVVAARSTAVLLA